MLEWKISKRGTNFCEYPIPLGAVYCIMPAHYVRGKWQPKACVWVENIELAFRNTHFVAFYMRPGYYAPRQMYVSGRTGWARSMQEYVRTSPTVWGNARPQIWRRDIACAAPRLRTVGAYIRRGVPTVENSPNTMTEQFVTHGCKVGKEFFTDEGYCSRVLGMDTPNYGGI